jgi:c(7)-type cytochrome triheme protein
VSGARLVGAVAITAITLGFAVGRHAAPPAWAVQPPPASVRIPIARAHPAGAPAEAARFSHVAHRQMNCHQCHPSPFPQAAWGFTHEDMRAGRACGACHEGQRASAITAHRCQECHAPR